MPSKAEQVITELLSLADVKINGNRPWDIKIHDERTYDRVLKDHSLGLGESFMDNWWSCESIDEFICRMLRANLDQKVKQNYNLIMRLFLAKIFNLKTISRSKKVAQVHYNLGNDLYSHMLGKTMAYTCAYWKDTNSLDKAQAQKYHLLCRKLELKPGETVLDIGCGWGGFAEYAAKNYKVKVVAINISTEQVAYAKELCKDLPIEVHLADYRDIKAYNPNYIKYDKAVSIGMFEHVGHLNYRTYMEVTQQQLKDEGIFLLHTIGGNKVNNNVDPCNGKYIFPNGMLPAAQQISKSIEDLFIMEDWHNFGPDYDKTLMAWFKNFDKNWHLFKDKYDERFYRMWSYYLLSCAGMFRARDGELWQSALNKGKPKKVYNSSR